MARAEKTPDPQPNTGSDVPKGRVRQLWMVYKLTRQVDKALDWWMLLSFVGPIVLGALVGILFDAVVYLAVLGIGLGLLVATIILARRAEIAMYRRAEGQPGGSLLALQNLRKGWSFDDQPVQLDPRTQDVVFRAVGRPGVILLAEGPPHRVRALVGQERKRLTRVLDKSVPVQVIFVGDGEDQVPLRKVSSKLLRMRPAPDIEKSDVLKIYQRLRSLGGIRPPIPKGVDPTRVRPDRKSSRGR